MFTNSFLLHYLILWEPLGYALAFVGMIVEGEVFLFSVSFLTRLGFFDFFYMFLAVYAGVFCGDSLWYLLGKKISKSKFFLARLAKKTTGKFDEQIKENTFRTLLLARFAYGFFHLTLVRCGMLRLPYKKLIKHDLAGALIWIAIISGLGYVFGESYKLVARYMKYAEIGFLIVIFIFIFGEKTVSKIFRRKI
jgi:membrane protein DedA with SNARE-associated domain